MNAYELMFIVNPTLEENSIKEVAETVKKVIEKHGKIEEVKEMGQKELAYEINKNKTGFYYLITFTADQKVVEEINHVANVNENILRHLVINLNK